MEIHDIVVRLISHPWVIAVLALTFFGCNFLAWVRVRREANKDYRRPRLPLN